MPTEEVTIVKSQQELLAEANAKITQAAIRDPVFYLSPKEWELDQRGWVSSGAFVPGWYFWDKKWERVHGKYYTEEAAREALARYVQEHSADCPADPPASEPPKEPPAGAEARLPWERDPDFIGPPRPPKQTAQPQQQQPPPASEAERLAQIRRDRGDLYGNAYLNHSSIGLMYTGILESHYQIKLPHPVPGHIVALLTTCIKLNREAFRPKQDNRDDAKNYLDICEECRLAEQRYQK